MREVNRVAAEREPYDITYRVNRSDGQQVWLGVLGRADYDASDQLVGMYGVIQDITERKVLEESLRSSEERLRLALDAVHPRDVRTVVTPFTAASIATLYWRVRPRPIALSHAAAKLSAPSRSRSR